MLFLLALLSGVSAYCHGYTVSPIQLMQLDMECLSCSLDNAPPSYKYDCVSGRLNHCSPIMFMVLFWLRRILNPSRHMTRVPLRSSVALTVAVDVMDPVLTSVTVNWNGGSKNTLFLLRRRRAREMLRDGISHPCPREGTVHVKVTVSPGHGLSTLVCNWALEAEKNTLSNVVSVTEVVSHQYSKLT